MLKSEKLIAKLTIIIISFFIILVLPHQAISKDDSDFYIYIPEAEEIENAVQYWTEDRIAEVPPLPIPIVDNISGIPKDKEYTAEPQQQPECQCCNSATGYPPWVWNIGKILTCGADGQCGWGSAQYIGLETVERRMLLTAAHALIDAAESRKQGKPVWRTNILFLQGYGVPVKRRICAMGIFKNYIDNPNYECSWDYGFIYMRDPSLVGSSLKLDTWNNETEVAVFGYPGNYFGGNVKAVCTGMARREMDGCYVRIDGNDMAGGISGGAWIRNLSSISGDNVNQVIAIAAASTGDTLFGPNFDQNMISLYHYIYNYGIMHCQ